ncbi:TRAP transporter large permease subunit [Kistimonas asteriae]|uniref:TRAP transporter large permease subunit n=1 Tax=Kistimonas asteriae TaxID=517724 RepID=UPI001BABD82C|nr:TRAP transporter large permease subunit [Kistimonas asteriae]
MYESVSRSRTLSDWLSSLPIALVLLLVIVLESSSMLHSRLLAIGGEFWPDYHELRVPAQAPACQPDLDIDYELAELLANQQADVDDELSLFDEEPADPAVLRASLERSQAECQRRHSDYASRQSQVTDGLQYYAAFEEGIAAIGDLGLNASRYILMTLLLVAAASATLLRDHIALRGIRTVRDLQVSSLAQLAGNALLLASALAYRSMQEASGIVPDFQQYWIQWGWIAGFTVLTLISLLQYLRRPSGLLPGGAMGHALLCIPLYSWMALISGVFFILIGHLPAMTIYLGKMLDLSGLFINVGLYVWIGMLLKQTRMASLVFDLFRPWRLPPEMLAFLAIMVSALPTAYTGASGIYVIAVGAVIYQELRRAGAQRQLALATTAMSGSMGVILNPCLLIVIIAALNKEVTTRELYGWGLWLFLLSASLFLVVSMVSRRATLSVSPVADAWPETVNTLKKLVPYALVIAVMVLWYRWGLNTALDEFSAPVILPAVMLAVVILDQWLRRRERSEREGNIIKDTELAVRHATGEASAHIGALLMLMALSICLGGVFDRGDVVSMLPEDLSSVWLTMALLVVILVLIGMIMDPYGAVILVTITLTGFAFNNGIDPLHFWMVTLIAFELGYLSPPVALNHLLTRQVVGDDEVDRGAVSGSFWQRYERFALPLLVMAVTLLLTAFVPLLFYA